MTDVVLYEVTDRAATITLNRPESRNALSGEVLRRLPELFGQADADDDVDVVIVTGADPAFCAGLDLKELGGGGRLLRSDAGGARAGDPALGTADGRPGPFPAITKPVIGAVNGAAVTGGLELALACDLLIASDRARFADTHARVGIQPGWGLSVLLPQAVGVRRAREMSLTGNYVDAATALDWGLVNRVVPHDELLATCRRLAADVASNDQPAVRRLLRTYAENQFGTVADGWSNEAAASSAWLASGAATPDAIEARRAAIQERGRAQSGA